MVIWCYKESYLLNFSLLCQSVPVLQQSLCFHRYGPNSVVRLCFINSAFTLAFVKVPNWKQIMWVTGVVSCRDVYLSNRVYIWLILLDLYLDGCFLLIPSIMSPLSSLWKRYLPQPSSLHPSSTVFPFSSPFTHFPLSYDILLFCPTVTLCFFFRPRPFGFLKGFPSSIDFL